MPQHARKPTNIREHNTRLLLSSYQSGEPLSPARLAPQLQMSRTAINQINELLLDQGLIESVGKGDSSVSGGKRPSLFRLCSTFGYFLSTHVEYDVIRAQLLDFNLNTVHEAAISVGGNPSLPVVAEAVSTLYRILCKVKNYALLGIAVAVHALVDAQSGVCLHATHFPSWGTNIELKRVLEKAIEDPVMIHVDSWMQYKTLELSVNAENTYNTDRFILVHAGSYGVVAGLWEGEHTAKMALEVGHMVVKADDTHRCRCGGRGCLESVLEYKHLITKAKSMQEAYPDSYLFSQNTINIDTITEGFNKNDHLCYILLKEIALWVAIALSNINMLYFPKVIILEGDFLKAGPAWEALLHQQVDAMCMTRLHNKIKLLFHAEESQHVFVGGARCLRSLYIKQYKS